MSGLDVLLMFAVAVGITLVVALACRYAPR